MGVKILIIIYIVLIVLVVLFALSKRAREKENDAIEKSDVFLKTPNIKYFGKFIRKEDGNIILKLHLEQVFIGTLMGVLTNESYILYMSFLAYDKNNIAIPCDCMYSAIKEYAEGEMVIGTSDVKSIDKKTKINMMLEIPANCVDENGKLDIVLNVTGSVVQRGVTMDEKVSNWKVSKTFN